MTASVQLPTVVSLTSGGRVDGAAVYRTVKVGDTVHLVAETTNEPGRRYPRRWRDIASGEMVDWPTVITRGGNPAQQLTPIAR